MFLWLQLLYPQLQHHLRCICLLHFLLVAPPCTLKCRLKRQLPIALFLLCPSACEVQAWKDA